MRCALYVVAYCEIIALRRIIPRCRRRMVGVFSALVSPYIIVIDNQANRLAVHGRLDEACGMSTPATRTPQSCYGGPCSR